MAWFGADTTRRRRVRRDRKSLQVRKQEAERRMVADCDCGVGLHGTLMRGGMERIGGIGGLGLISGKNLVLVREMLELSRFVGCVVKTEVVQVAGLRGLCNCG